MAYIYFFNSFFGNAYIKRDLNSNANAYILTDLNPTVSAYIPDSKKEVIYDL